MSCDSYYGIGDRHQVCQDYALHGSAENMEYVIVADGCSSAEYSEIGAQILCHAAKYQIALSNQTGLFQECSLSTLSSVLGNGILKRIDEVRMSYPISKSALEATLLIAIKVPLKTFVFVWGDGVIIECFRREDGTEHYVICDIDFTNNTPFYLIYNREQYIENLVDEGYEPRTYYTYYFSGSEGSNKREKYSDGMPYMSSSEHEGSVLTSLTVCSDGIKSFQDVDKKPVELINIVPEIIGYKSTDGEFVKKRMFFLKRKAEKNNWSHFDDIGCGTIII